MRGRIIAVLALAIVYRLFFHPYIFSQTGDPRFEDGVIYMKTEDTLSTALVLNSPEIKPLVSVYGIKELSRPFFGLNEKLDHTYRIAFTGLGQTEDLLVALQKIQGVQYAERAPAYHVNYVPNDYSEKLWYLKKIGAPSAWDATKGNSKVVIAILDNAVRITHRDLVPNLWTNPGEVPGNNIDDDLDGYVDDVHGYDVADQDPDPNPPANTADVGIFSHGTHVAGIAGAATDNSIGISSLGFNVRIMAVKCSYSKSAGDVINGPFDGIVYAIRAHANIINMSWSDPVNSITGQNIIQAAHDHGIVLVAAAGNDNSMVPQFPASYDNVISVGSTDENDTKSVFSSYGPTVDLMAPGTAIWSTSGGSDNAYGEMSGTSMSGALVSALSALLLTVTPTLTPSQVEVRIKSACDNIDEENPFYAGKMGAGRLDAAKVFAIAPETSTAVTEVSGMVVSIHPNPSNGTFFVTIENDDGLPKQWQIATTSGFLMSSGELPPGLSGMEISHQVVVKGLTPGMYIFQLSEGGKIIESKRIEIDESGEY